jgi:hypothetical protein
MHQDGFSLIIGIVPHGDGARPYLKCNTIQECVPGTASCLFNSQPVISSQGRCIDTLG